MNQDVMIEIWDIYIYITKNVNISGGDWHPGPQKGNNGRPTINLSAAMLVFRELTPKTIKRPECLDSWKRIRSHLGFPIIFVTPPSVFVGRICPWNVSNADLGGDLSC